MSYVLAILTTLILAVFLHGRRTGRRYPIVLVVLCSVLAFLTYREVVRARQEGSLSHVATALAGGAGSAGTVRSSAMKVHCQGLLGFAFDVSGLMGHVPWPANGDLPTQAYLRHDTCSALASYPHHRARPSADEIKAVHTLTHESMHLRGIGYEAAAECAAVQRDSRTAELLGASPAQAALLAHRYWTLVYPWMPNDYKSSECRPGAEMDEHLPGAPW